MKSVKLAVLASFVALASVSCGKGPASDKASLAAAAKNGKSLFVSFSDVRLDPNLNVGSYESVALTLDLGAKVARIDINTCPKGSICVWNGPTYVAGKLTSHKDSCGVVRYKAVTDARLVDGPYQEIQVSDHSDDICEYVTAQQRIQAVLIVKSTDMRTGASSESQSFFGSKDGFTSQRGARK